MSRNGREHEVSEAELVRQAQAGASTAFAQLVGLYQDRIYNTCYRMTHSHADALDLTQSTFLRALEALDRYRGHAAFYTWLFRIAVNLTISHRRKHQRRAVQSLDVTDPEGTSRAPQLAARPQDSDAGARLRRMELQDHVERALSRLPDEFRAAVILKDIEDLDYAAIAEILGVPAGTVKSRIHRGRMMLREWLVEEQDERDRPRAEQA